MLTINSESDIINNVDSEGNESCIVQGYESNYQNQWIAHLIPGQDVDQNGLGFNGGQHGLGVVLGIKESPGNDASKRPEDGRLNCNPKF